MKISLPPIKIALAPLCVLLIGILVGLAALPSGNTVTINVKWLPDNTEMAGLSTNDYKTNISAVIYSTPNINQPTNQWPVIASSLLVSLVESPPGIYTYSFPMDGKSRFYAVVMTNGNGGTSPFSNLAPGLTGPNAGVLLPLKLQ